MEKLPIIIEFLQDVLILRQQVEIRPIQDHYRKLYKPIITPNKMRGLSQTNDHTMKFFRQKGGTFPMGA
jgi:hypothetical protein